MKLFNPHLRCALQVLAASLMPLTTGCMTGAPEADNAGQPDGGSEKNGATNVALGGTAAQSSTAYNSSPSRAIDGNTSGRWGERSVTHTAQTAAPWWRVDLGNAHRVDRVTLWNRTSCCSERLSNFHVDYLDAQGNVIVSQDYPEQAGPTTEIVLSARGVHAVRVQLYGANPLSLAEVQVWGAPDAGSDDRPKWCVGADTDAVEPPVYDDGIACNFCPSLNANTAVGWEKDGICSKARTAAIWADLRTPGSGACASARTTMASTCCIADYQPPRDPMRALCVDQPGTFPSTDLCKDGCFPSAPNRSLLYASSGAVGYWLNQQGDRTNTCLQNDIQGSDIRWTCKKVYYLLKFGHLPTQLAQEVAYWWNRDPGCGCDGQNTHNPDNQD